MNPKEHRRKQHLRQTTEMLKRQSFELYVRLLARLLHSHKSYDILKPLSDALRRRDWPDVYAQADCLSAQKYTDATLHFVANQFALLIKKYPWDSKLVELDPKEAAIRSFFKAERRCGRINRKFDLLAADPAKDLFRAQGKLAMAWIRTVIGSTPSYTAIMRECDFGQGASVGVHGDATHVIRKISDEQKWTVSPGAIHHAFGGLMRNHHYFETLLGFKEYDDGSKIACVDYENAFERYLARLEVVNSNKLGFVLKTAKTHRSIATEPLLNGFFQKGIDTNMRRKLLKVGIDLSDQGLNQKMAYQGSLDDSGEGFVTVDLRNASNSVAIKPVKYLYPPDWFSLLDRTRSHYLSFDGKETRYEMLCSMGNGFCFPVQTLMFAAICVGSGAGVPGVDFMVYGDDIIVRKKHVTKVLAMLKHYGFATNTEKTFLEGPFRESCGTDWFNGEDVRPFTLDFAFDKIECFFKYFNLTQRSDRTSQFFAPGRELMMSALPIDYRFFRPRKGEVDTGIDALGDEHLTSPHCKFLRGQAMWEWQELIHVPIIDVSRLIERRHEPWLMGVALKGAKAVRLKHPETGLMFSLPEVVFRRKTRAKITSNGYSATCNVLPTLTNSWNGKFVC